jgi:hypothetical protein
MITKRATLVVEDSGDDKAHYEIEGEVRRCMPSGEIGQSLYPEILVTTLSTADDSVGEDQDAVPGVQRRRRGLHFVGLDGPLPYTPRRNP